MTQKATSSEPSKDYINPRTIPLEQLLNRTGVSKVRLTTRGQEVVPSFIPKEPKEVS